MKKQELLKYLDDNLMDKLYGFCYARTNDSYEAQDLCSDIIFALVKAAGTQGEVSNFYPFLWRIARNVYADFSEKKRKRADAFYEGDAEELLQSVAAREEPEEWDELLQAVYKRLAFLTRAYREVMILYYLEGLSAAEIAKRQNTSPVAVRQRLFQARQKIKSEVEKMTEMDNRPMSLKEIDFEIWGTGRPSWGDPRDVCTRMLSRHMVWLCHKKPMSASEIAEELNVPTVYVEEELEILTKGTNGEYGLLRRLENGKYAINFVLLDSEAIEKANAIYLEYLPRICGILSYFIEAYKKEYLAFPYLNKRVDLNLILWQQIRVMVDSFSGSVRRILSEKYFSRVPSTDRPFSVYGYVLDKDGRSFGAGWDGTEAANICGFSRVKLENIYYFARIKPHFHCGHNVATDPQLQLAIRAIQGLKISDLSEEEKEHAAKAVECGYLYREGEALYTKILVNSMEDNDRLFGVSVKLRNGYFQEEAELIAEKIADLIRRTIPEYLLGEWRFANDLASYPIFDNVVEELIRNGILTPPKDGVGAEGCWMSVMK